MIRKIEFCRLSLIEHFVCQWWTGVGGWVDGWDEGGVRVKKEEEEEETNYHQCRR